MDLVALGHSDEIANNAAKEYILNQYTPAVEIFVVRKSDHFYGYLNRCPHTGANLNWQPDQFFDYFKEFLHCSIHGALFVVENGYCVRGPCAGMSLKPVGIVLKERMLYYQPDQNKT